MEQNRIKFNLLVVVVYAVIEKYNKRIIKVLVNNGFKNLYYKIKLKMNMKMNIKEVVAKHRLTNTHTHTHYMVQLPI